MVATPFLFMVLRLETAPPVTLPFLAEAADLTSSEGSWFELMNFLLVP